MSKLSTKARSVVCTPLAYTKGVTVIQDRDEYSTDLMKCITEVEKEEQGAQVSPFAASGTNHYAPLTVQFPLLLVGGLSGRIDQTVHTISLLHKLRATRSESYVLSGESLAWVLDAGSHIIDVDHATMGQTCGILPVGVDRAMVVTKGLKWNLGTCLTRPLSRRRLVNII